MLMNLRNKVTSKSGASDMIVVLIIIIIFAAVAFLVFKGIGNKSKEAGSKAVNQMDKAFQEAEDFSTGTLE
ncbi:MAG: hypothetical protein RR620_09020 [Clostridium sp.]